MRRGILVGAAMMLTPDEKNKGEFRRQEMATRMREYAFNADALHTGRKHMRFWPTLMPGGWPLPPTVPSDDESTWWPEVDGWPCPPPELRGGSQNRSQDSEGQP